MSCTICLVATPIRTPAKLFLHPFDDNRILVSARDELLTLYDGQKVVPFPTQADDYLKTHKVYTTALLPDGSICITTLNGGAVILTHDGGIREIIDKTSGLLDSETVSAYSDREGTLWLGMGSGVARVEVNSPISIILRNSALSAIRFQESIYASSVASNALARVVFDPETGRPSSVPIHGPNQGWNMIDFKDPTGKSPHQLLVATSEGVMKLQGDSLVPAMPAVHGLTEQTYVIDQSVKYPSRIFIGHSDGVGSMRWDGQKWIDEGRLPKTIYEARGIVEDADGVLWVSGGSRSVLRVEVAASGMRDSKYQVFSQNEGLPEGQNDVEFVAGSIFATVDRSKHIFRWDPRQRPNSSLTIAFCFLSMLQTSVPALARTMPSTRALMRVFGQERHLRTVGALVSLAINPTGHGVLMKIPIAV